LAWMDEISEYFARAGEKNSYNLWGEKTSFRPRWASLLVA